MKLVYVAGPFRGANAWEVECNIRRAETLALEVWRLGAAAICPHANTRFFSGAADDSVWLDGDIEILSRCDAIFMVPGWGKSSGSTAELIFATNNGIPAFYTRSSLKEWLELQSRVDECRKVEQSRKDYFEQHFNGNTQRGS